VLAFALLACVRPAQATWSTLLYEAGMRETGRLRTVYEQWRTEQPRKVAIMEVRAEDLSAEARRAGYLNGVVDAEIVMLFTERGKEGAAGFVFGHPTPDEIEGLQKMGFVFTPTLMRGMLRFGVKGKSAAAHSGGGA